MHPYRTPCPIPPPAEEPEPIVRRVEPPPTDRGGSNTALVELSEHWAGFWREFEAGLEEPGPA